MKKTWIVLTLLSLSALSAAQATKPIGLSVRLGLFYPTSSVAQDEGKSWFGGGVDYKLGDLPSSKVQGYSASYTVSLDMFSKGDFRSVPILANYVVRRNDLYFFGGAGVSFTRTRKGADTENSTELAFQVGVGYEVRRGNLPLFGELKWMGNAESDLSGFGVFVGVRF